MNNKRNSQTRKNQERRKKERQIRQIRHALIFTMLVILALMYAAAKREVELKKTEEAGKTEAAAGKLESDAGSGNAEDDHNSGKDAMSGSGKSDKEKSDLEDVVSGNPGSEKKVDSLILKDEDMWCLYLTNEHYPVPDNQQINLVQVPETEQTVDERIYEPLMKMIEDARAQGMRIHMCSGYRTKEKQTELFENKVQHYIREGKTEEEACNLTKRSISVPDSGEHRLGLAADFISDTYTVLEEGFGDTPEGQWLREHCTEYGFILRYPKEKEEITGIDYEPWHFRYVGVKVAEYMKEHDMCLEEFYVAQSLYG